MSTLKQGFWINTNSNSQTPRACVCKNYSYPCANFLTQNQYLLDGEICNSERIYTEKICKQ